MGSGSTGKPFISSPVIRGRRQEGESRKEDLRTKEIVMICNWLAPDAVPAPSLPSPV
jgi:hypothetical protein